MTTDLEQLMANLSDSERDRLKGAFAADPELARGLSTMLADLPPGIQEELMRRLAARLETTSLGGGALVPALTDVIQEALERWDREEG
jgi:signal transduction histidine kinase